MLACISCSKQVAEGEDDYSLSPMVKEETKSFATQVKEMAQKLKPCAGSMTTTNYKRGSGPFSKGSPCHYTGPASSSSMPAWDLGSSAQLIATLNSQAPFNNRQVCSGLSSVNNEHMGSKEWIAQVEPGVHVTFAALPDGGNDLRRLRFSRVMFDKWQAQRWWGENYDRILELYNVRRSNHQTLQTPIRSEDGSDSYPRLDQSERDNPIMTSMAHYNKSYGYQHQAGSSSFRATSIDAARTTTSSRDGVSVSGCSDLNNEWVEQDELGVYITIRQMVDGTRELRRVRFSRERFVEGDAKQWWEENRDRIQAQYL